MRRRSHLLIAVVIGALLALAVAVPVVAGTLLGDPAISGYARMYEYTSDVPTETAQFGGEDWDAVRPSSVRITFDTKADPYSFAYLLVGTRLAPRTEYVLLNPFQVFLDPGEATYLANVYDIGRTNKAGMLTLKGKVGASNPEHPYLITYAYVPPEEPGEPTYLQARLLSGGDLWLVPTDVFPEELEGHAQVHAPLPSFPHPEAGWVYVAQGVPAIGFWDYAHRR